jgi:hypothetical protein
LVGREYRFHELESRRIPTTDIPVQHELESRRFKEILPSDGTCSSSTLDFAPLSDICEHTNTHTNTHTQRRRRRRRRWWWWWRRKG